jgi:hypothetical protein
MLVAMQRGALVVALAGCGFHGAEAPDARTIDVALDVGAGFCDPIDGLIACYEFEGNTNDATANHLDAMAVSVVFVAGHVGNAMLLAADSDATVAASPKFDVAQLTIEAWVNPSTLPAPIRASVVLAVNGQYSLWINDNGTLSCDLHGATRVTSTATVAAMTWSHVACTYDTMVARVYVNGVAVSRNATGDLTPSGNEMAIGSNSPGSPLIGMIDELRLLSVARTGPQICSDAGQSSCP